MSLRVRSFHLALLLKQIPTRKSSTDNEGAHYTVAQRLQKPHVEDRGWAA